MKDLTLFLPDLAADSYLVPEIVQVQQLRSAAIEFCERSCCWQEVQQPYPLRPGKYRYDLTIDAGQLVHEIRDGHLDGNCERNVVARSPAWCNERYPGWQSGQRTGEPRSVTQLDPTDFYTVPAPAAAVSLILTVALKPARDATLVPDILYNDHYEPIIAGAKARLFGMQGQKWSNPQLAIAYAAEFNDAVMHEKRRMEKGFGRARHRVKGLYV